MPRRLSPPSDGAMLDTWGRQNRRLADKQCEACSKTFRPVKSTARFCSRPCMWSKNGGQNRHDGPTWWIGPKGYIEGRIKRDGMRVHVRQHRWIMEQHLGRALLPEEDVHHRNGVKSDNHIENLELITHARHSSLSNTSRIHPRGYTLNLSDQERAARAERMRLMRLSKAEGSAA